MNDLSILKFFKYNKDYFHPKLFYYIGFEPYIKLGIRLGYADIVYNELHKIGFKPILIYKLYTKYQNLYQLISMI